MSENRDNHGFSVLVAQEIGVNRAIMLQHFKHLQIAFLDKEKSAKEVWVKRSRRALSETYPYFTEKEIRGCLDRLERDEYIRAKVDNALNYDRTKSYQLDKKGWDLMGDPASDKRANRKEKASDKRANEFDERANDNLTKGPMNIGNCSSVVTSFVEGERTPPAPNSSNLKEEKKESGLVAPGRAEKSTADIIFETAAEYGIEAEPPPSKKVAPKKDSPAQKDFSEKEWERVHHIFGDPPKKNFEVTAIASPTDLPGVTIVEAAPKIRAQTTIEAEHMIATWIKGDGIETVKSRFNVAKQRFDPENADAIALHYCSCFTKNAANKGRLLADPITHFSDGLFSYLKNEESWGRNSQPKEGGATRNVNQPNGKATLNRYGSDPAKYQEKPLF